MKAKLYYDGNCPICNNYVRMLKKKLDANKIEFVPSAINLKDFQYVGLDKRVYSGDKAIEKLATEFPRVQNYLWMLPDKYKIKTLQAIYKVSSRVRQAIKPKAKRKGCGCGGKK